MAGIRFMMPLTMSSADLQGLDELAWLRAMAWMSVTSLAADMGGMGFIENNKALCMLSVLINTHMVMAAKEHELKSFFYSSSACVYNADKQVKRRRRCPQGRGCVSRDA